MRRTSQVWPLGRSGQQTVGVIQGDLVMLHQVAKPAGSSQILYHVGYHARGRRVRGRVYHDRRISRRPTSHLDGREMDGINRRKTVGRRPPRWCFPRYAPIRNRDRRPTSTVNNRAPSAPLLVPGRSYAGISECYIAGRSGVIDPGWGHPPRPTGGVWDGWDCRDGCRPTLYFSLSLFFSLSPPLFLLQTWTEEEGARPSRPSRKWVSSTQQESQPGVSAGRSSLFNRPATVPNRPATVPNYRTCRPTV